MNNLDMKKIRQIRCPDKTVINTGALKYKGDTVEECQKRARKQAADIALEQGFAVCFGDGQEPVCVYVTERTPNFVLTQAKKNRCQIFSVVYTDEGGE